MMRTLTLLLTLISFGLLSMAAEPLDKATLDKIENARVELNLALFEHKGFRLFLRWYRLNQRAVAAMSTNPQAEQVITDLYTFEGSVKDMLFGPPPTQFEIDDKKEQFDRIEEAVRRAEFGRDPYPDTETIFNAPTDSLSLSDIAPEYSDFIYDSEDVQLLAREQLLRGLYDTEIAFGSGVDPFHVCMSLTSPYSEKIRQGEALTPNEQWEYKKQLSQAESLLIEKWRQPDWKLPDEKPNQSVLDGDPFRMMFPPGFEDGDISAFCEETYELQIKEGAQGAEAKSTTTRVPTPGEALGER